MNYVRIESVSVVKALYEFIEREAAPGTSISAEAFWSGFADLLREFGPRNRELLQLRNELQSRIDQYHRERSGEPLDVGDYERFLHNIGYLLPEGDDVTIRTTNVDDTLWHGCHPGGGQIGSHLGMSASPPIAFELWCRGGTTRGARTGLMQCSKKPPPKGIGRSNERLRPALLPFRLRLQRR